MNKHVGLRRVLSVLTLCATAAFPVVSFGGTFKHITIDGDFTDWAGVPVAYSDPSEETARDGTDFKETWIANDADYLYVRFTLYNSGDLLRSQNNVFVNGDGDPSTGYNVHGTGSEMLIQGGTGYQEKNGTFNDGFNINGLGWASAPAGVTNQFEFRISRKARFDDGTDVFTSSTIGLLLETENNNYAEVDVAADDGPMPYEFAPSPPAAHGNFDLVSMTGATWRFNKSGADLGAEWRDLGYDDSQAGWESGKALFGKTPNPSAYAAPIATPFTDNHTTYYFRTGFTWPNDSAGLSLVLSSYISDGAVVYLNGAEVGRVRMPAGPISSSTPATGPNANPGVLDVLDLPRGALVVGDNVLAVEVHQSANDTTELVFGAALLASDHLPVAIVTPTAPQTLTVEEGSPVTFAVTVRGAEPITYQWFKGGVAIQDATNSTYTITAVAAGDAGQYQMQAANAATQNVLSPIFTLQTQAVPVTITDSTRPADVTTTEGLPASFSLAVAGSQPISFQWFKDGVAIRDATNQDYVIASVAQTDAGQYTAVVSNRVTAPLTSRAARLTVNSDTVPPTLLSATGGGTRILLKFSEPVGGNSLGTAQFTLSPAVTVTGAHAVSSDPTAVVLDSAALVNGTLYTLSITGLTDRFSNPIRPGTSRQFRAGIVIDGDFSDWAGVPLAISDPEDAGADTGAHSDFKDVWVTSDNNYIYVRFTLWSAADPFIYFNNIFVDADNDPATGYAINGIGSDMLIQGGGGYEQKPGVFNNGTIDNLDWLAAPNPPATDFEVRFSRAAKYANPGAGGLVFKSDAIALVLESENNGFVAKEFVPDSGSSPLTHTLLNYAPTDLGLLVVSRQGGQITLSWGSVGKLQETASLSTPSWKDVPNPTNPYGVTVSGQQHYYRLISQ